MQTHRCPVCYSQKIRSNKHLYLECDVCSFLYLKLMPPESFFRRAIQRYGKRILAESQSNKLNGIIKQRLHDISVFTKSGATLLDVGSGMGLFVRFAQERGYKAAAMDKAVPCITYLRNLGMQTYTNLVQVPNGSYDAVTMFDVIEHIKNPHTFLKIIRKKLKKNGVLTVTTPNVKGISSRIIPTLLTWARVRYSEHAVLYTTSALKRLLVDEGFTPLTCTTDIFIPWCQARHVIVRKFINKLVFLIFRPFLPSLYSHELGDNIQIIATY